MSKRLKSHPHLMLHEHVEQVTQAIQGICKWHTPYSLTDELKSLLIKLAQVHDLGKATSAFQEYITCPECYKGDPMHKAHTPLSLLLTLFIAKEEGWNSLETLMLAAAAAGHHSGLPTIPEQKIGGVNCPQCDFDNFAGGDKATLLIKQLGMINFNALEKETGLNFNDTGIKTWLNDPAKLLRTIKRFVTREIYRSFFSLDLTMAVEFRLTAQLVFSILSEADKAFLAVANPEQYILRKVNSWDPGWVDIRIGSPDDTKTNRLRHSARNEIINSLNQDTNIKLYNLVAPTGCGKTLLAATWALKLKKIAEEEGNFSPKVIIVLPFLSVIDQTAKEYQKLLKAGGQDVDGYWLLTSHSLSDRQYAKGLEEEDSRFFIDTWRSEIIITTYDQFLMSLMDPRAKYQMRFHNLCDALIVMDEVQSLPCKLWQPLNIIFNELVKMGNSKMLLMSATLPPFINNTKSLLIDYPKYFKGFGRYLLQLRIKEKIDIDLFCEELEDRLSQWLEKGSRVLITLNTRQSARIVRDYLEQNWPIDYAGTPLFFISADVTPRDRIRIIDIIKMGKPCVVVSTQCIEAGVDIDMDRVIRDFAPLDSLIQIAGRCNREGRQDNRGIVEIVELTNDNGNSYSEMIYDDVHLQVTRQVLESYTEVAEENILALSDCYFQELFNKKDTGTIHLNRFAWWQEDIPIRQLLRGKERLQITFLVMEQDPSLRQDMINVSLIEDKWQRREGWKKLAGRIAMISVNVYAQYGFHPQSIADEFLGNWWVLREGYYSSERGLIVEGECMIM